MIAASELGITGFMNLFTSKFWLNLLILHRPDLQTFPPMGHK